MSERVVEARQMINVSAIEQASVSHLLEGSYEVLRNHIRRSWPRADVNKMTLEVTLKMTLIRRSWPRADVNKITLEMVLTAVVPANEIEESTDERVPTHGRGLGQQVSVPPSNN